MKEIKEAKVKKLSDDIYDLQISIGGSVYQFPMSYRQFVEDGWSYQGDETQSTRSGDYMISQDFVNGGNSVVAYIVNYGIKGAPINECHLGGIALNIHGVKDSSDVILARGIQLGQSSVDDIRKAYGAPTYLRADGYSTTLTYENDVSGRIILDVQDKRGKLTSISIMNMEEPGIVQAQ